MKKLLMIAAIAALWALACKRDEQPISLCPECPGVAICIADTCACRPIAGEGERRLINGKWCERAGAFVAHVNDWYCMDTFSVWLNLPASWPYPDEIMGEARIQSTHNGNFGVGNGSLHTLSYYPRPDGDSMVILLPTSTHYDPMGGSRCHFPEGFCAVYLFGKFRSPDTIDAVLRLHCYRHLHPRHGEENRILMTRIK